MDNTSEIISAKEDISSISTEKIETMQEELLQLVIENIKYDFYMNHTPKGWKFTQKTYRDVDILLPAMVLSVDLVIIVHGSLSSSKEKWIQKMRKLFDELGKNVLLVDWSSCENKYEFESADLVEYIGDVIARFLDSIEGVKGETIRNIHCIGQGLGAHISGISSKYRAESVKIFDRITGLDPVYLNIKDDIKLNKRHADFVDVIHSNVNTEISPLGINEPLGHMDFYPDRDLIKNYCSGKLSYFYNKLSSMVFRKKSSKDIQNKDSAHIYFIDSLEQEVLKRKKENKSPKDQSKSDEKMLDAENGTKVVEMGINAIKYKDFSHDPKNEVFLVTSPDAPVSGTSKRTRFSTYDLKYESKTFVVELEGEEVEK